MSIDFFFLTGTRHLIKPWFYTKNLTPQIALPIPRIIPLTFCQLLLSLYVENEDIEEFSLQVYLRFSSPLNSQLKTKATETFQSLLDPHTYVLSSLKTLTFTEFFSLVLLNSFTRSYYRPGK